MATINFGGVTEEVITGEEYPLEKARELLKNEVVAILGYGVQGPGQALNLRDNGIRVSCLCPMGVDTALLRPKDAVVQADQALMQRAVKTAGAVLTPDVVADEVMAAIADERFLILPHPEVLDMYRHKGTDYDRWLRGMRRFQRSLS